MEEDLLIRVFEVFQRFQDGFNLLIVTARVFQKEETIDICVVSELIRNQSETHIQPFSCWPEVANTWHLSEVLELRGDLSLEIFDLEQLHCVSSVLQDAVVVEIVERENSYHFSAEYYISKLRIRNCTY